MLHFLYNSYVHVTDLTVYLDIISMKDNNFDEIIRH